MGDLDSALYWRADLPDLPPPYLLITAGLVLLAALAVVAWWVIGHPDRMLVPVHRLRARSTVERLERRYARQLRFVAEQLRPKSSAALILMAALGAVGLLVGTLTEITEDVVTGEERSSANRAGPTCP
ncbi:MAG: hypothetical protein ACT4NY_21650 [Pseudonocardiales bacterium]